MRPSGIWYLDLRAANAAAISAYKFFSDGFPLEHPYPARMKNFWEFQEKL